ncbi:hypothetical protein P175DRAFT_0353340 [Aspergillus ochraceoroseus IBT 24754]|uniref:Uncharacterized protein n=1 Tax=Aspergillus ochraceoroseus IBT 24754 TaxID=1392256 RepID=A0A2T5LPI7_9EURO|nr:uncharacterized protein P175DRAFT_0353340 [Aspergillus ochraceoroseus IBT 24754]PTU18194.1 hypothetical protein P175DRAFT_0353340 [Aspergillus ochraceoroseus IBT 24754]
MKYQSAWNGCGNEMGIALVGGQPEARLMLGCQRDRFSNAFRERKRNGKKATFGFLFTQARMGCIKRNNNRLSTIFAFLCLCLLSCLPLTDATIYP